MGTQNRPLPGPATQVAKLFSVSRHFGIFFATEQAKYRVPSCLRDEDIERVKGTLARDFSFPVFFLINSPSFSKFSSLCVDAVNFLLQARYKIKPFSD